MWNNQKQQKSCFPLFQTYKRTIISKKWTNIQEASGTKRCKDNQLQSLELPCRISQ